MGKSSVLLGLFFIVLNIIYMPIVGNAPSGETPGPAPEITAEPTPTSAPTTTPVPRLTPDEQGRLRFIDSSTPEEDWCGAQDRLCFYEDLDPNFLYTAPAGLRIQTVVVFVYTSSAKGVYLGWLNPPDYPTCDNRFDTYCLTAKRDIAGAFSIGLSRRMTSGSLPNPIAVVDIQLVGGAAANGPGERFSQENAPPGSEPIR